MTDRIEETLKTTFGSAAERAPAPRADLIAHVQRRHRRRRAGRAGVSAALAITLIGGLTVAGQAVISPKSTRSLSGNTLRTPPVAKPVPVRTAWPQAVHVVPNTLPDGGPKYHPQQLIDDHTLLATAEAGFERPNALWRYDLKSGRATRIATVPIPAKAATFAADFTVGDGQIAWWHSVKGERGAMAEIWAVPLSGGTPRRVTTAPLDAGAEIPIEHLTIAKRKVVWSTRSDGVYEAPLSGGTARPLSGTTGYHIVDWPWIGSAGVHRGQSVQYERLRNIRTGERRTAELSQYGQWTCGLTWCVGDNAMSAFAQRRDGEKGHTMFGGSMRTAPETPALDRFVLGVVGPPLSGSKQLFPKGTYLYDLESGKVADLGIAHDAEHRSISRPDDRLYYVEGKDTYVLIDLMNIK